MHFSERDPLWRPGRLFQFQLRRPGPGVFLHIRPSHGPIPCRHRRSDLPGTSCRQTRAASSGGPMP